MERFFKENQESLKSPEKSINKAVLIMYPDVRTTGPAENLLIKESQFPPSFYQEVHEKYEKTIQAYKRNGFKIIGVVYNDTLPNKFSPFYPQKEFDLLLPVATDIKNWKHSKHESLLAEVLEKINLSPKAKIILGGFHSEDCVIKMGEVLKRKSLNPKINTELTEKQVEIFALFRKLNKILSSGLEKSHQEVRGVIKEEIEDNKNIIKEEARKMASLLKNKE